MTPFPEDLHEKTAAPVKSAAVAVRQYESLRWHCPNQVCGSKRMLTLSRAAPRVCSLHDRTKPPACQGRNVKSSPLCGTGTLHGCGFRLYTRCVKQKRELVRAKILNVTGEKMNHRPHQRHRARRPDDPRPAGQCLACAGRHDPHELRRARGQRVNPLFKAISSARAAAAARAFSHLLLCFGCNRASGMIQLKCCVTTAFTQGRLQILHGEEGIQLCGRGPCNVVGI